MGCAIWRMLIKHGDNVNVLSLQCFGAVGWLMRKGIWPVKKNLALASPRGSDILLLKMIYILI